MARLTPEQKAAAGRNQDAANYAGAACIAVGGLAVIPILTPFVVPAVAVAGAAMLVRSTHQGKLVRDPPRSDFEQRTTLGASTLDLSFVEPSAVSEPAVRLATAEDEIARLLDATVTALERASGAELAGEADSASQRLDEAYEFLETVLWSLENSSQGAGELGEALTPYRATRSPLRPARDLRRILRRATPTSELPSSVLDELRRAAFPDSVLRRPLPATDYKYPVRRLILDLDELAHTNLIYGRFLRASITERTVFISEFGESPGAPPVSA